MTTRKLLRAVCIGHAAKISLFGGEGLDPLAVVSLSSEDHLLGPFKEEMDALICALGQVVEHSQRPQDVLGFLFGEVTGTAVSDEDSEYVPRPIDDRLVDYFTTLLEHVDNELTVLACIRSAGDFDELTREGTAASLETGDECPNCGCGTVDVVCRGECGGVLGPYTRERRPKSRTLKSLNEQSRRES